MLATPHPVHFEKLSSIGPRSVAGLETTRERAVPRSFYFFEIPPHHLCEAQTAVLFSYCLRRLEPCVEGLREIKPGLLKVHVVGGGLGAPTPGLS